MFSPITHSHPLVKEGVRKDFKFWMMYDRQFIDWCDWVIVAVPPGEDGRSRVENSRGVQTERGYARISGKGLGEYVDGAFENLERLI